MNPVKDVMLKRHCTIEILLTEQLLITNYAPTAVCSEETLSSSTNRHGSCYSLHRLCVPTSML